MPVKDGQEAGEGVGQEADVVADELNRRVDLMGDSRRQLPDRLQLCAWARSCSSTRRSVMSSPMMTASTPESLHSGEMVSLRNRCRSSRARKGTLSK